MPVRPEAKALRCPSCGGPTVADQPRCRYCASRLATLACPRCFALASVDADHCPRCGTALADEAPETSPFACPECRTALEIRRLGSVPAHTCPRCAGIWLDAEHLQDLADTRDRRHAALHLLPETEPGEAPDLHRPVRYHRCPQCRQPMNRQNYARISGVIVDVCRNHGTWFEKDELRRVLAFIDGGGLDRARTRQILKAEEAEREARRAQQLTALGGMPPGEDRWF